MVLPCLYGSIWTLNLTSLHMWAPLSIYPLTLSQSCFQSQNHFLSQSHLFIDNILKYLYLLPQVISLIQCQLDFPGLSILLPVWPLLCDTLLQHSVLLDAVGSLISQYKVSLGLFCW